MNSLRPFQVTMAAAFALTALPLGFDASTMTVHLVQAVAGQSEGHANGHANGHAGGNSNGGGNANSNGNANGQSQSKGASGLGSLNAAHASDTALENADAGSQVGKIAAYKELEEAALKAAEDAAAGDATVEEKQKLLDDAIANGADQATIDQLTKDLEDAKKAAMDAADAAAQAQADADAALVDASNKDITDGFGNVLSDIRDAVNGLLGID